MIRWRVYRAGGRMRTLTKIQIVAAILVGFCLGYIFLPSSMSYSDAGPPGAVLEDRFIAKPRVPGIQISADGKDFIVEGKTKRILSGALHYFRVVPAYWEDRLRKLLAAGLNTVETYVPWNAHEPIPGVFDFTGILDIHEFIVTAQQLGLHVIVRPGPYICAEWELGGLPAWLLHDPNMKLRSNYPPYTKAVSQYLKRLFGILVPLQSAHGGPIIGFQVENEYAYWSNGSSAQAHLKFLYKLMKDVGALEVMFTSDGQYRIKEALEMKPHRDVIHTLNFQNTNNNPLQKLKEKVPEHPLMVMEFWTGWFDHWGEEHLERNISPLDFNRELRGILAEGASVNLYMFHGGTNFGFMNGGNWGAGEEVGTTYHPTVSSYDYDAPLSEWGSLNQKYMELREVLSEMVPESMTLNPLPPLPSQVPTVAYGEVKMTLYISLLSTLQYVPEPHSSESPIPMEYLPLNHGSGQAYGYVLYRTFIPSSALVVTIHGLKDYGLVMVDLKPVKEVAYFNKITLNLPPPSSQGLPSRHLDILVENGGRVNFGRPLEVRKGISGDVVVDGVVQNNWKIYSLEFKKSFVESIDSGGLWLRTPSPVELGPALFKGSFTITDTPRDTFIDMQGWNKGVVFVNGANLGRYWKKGPTGTLYVPAPILNRGINKVMIFEFSHSKSPPQPITFRSSPILDISQPPR